MREILNWRDAKRVSEICVVAPTQKLAEEVCSLIDQKHYREIDVVVATGGRQEIVDCGLWYLAEYEGPQTLAEQAAAGEPAAQGEQATKGAPAIQQDAASGGRFTLNRNPREFSSIEAYLRRQGRFKQLADEDVAAITAARDAKWAAMRRDWT